MQITSGLFDHMVLQRNAKNVSAATMDDVIIGNGRLVATVRQNGKIVPGFDAKKLGDVKKGKVRFELKGLPAGGPYDIELAVVGRDGAAIDALKVSDVLVGDVWISAGQSNMQGSGDLAGRIDPEPLVRAFYMDDRWGVAHDPIQNMWACVDDVHIELIGGVRPPAPPDLPKTATVPSGRTGTGPAVAFGQEMQRLTGVPQGIIASAHGGTSMTQWDPARKKEGGNSLYGATIRRFQKNGSKVAGIIWYQGESDCFEADAPLYTARMKKLVASFRRDCADAALPIVIVQLSRYVGGGWDPAAWNSVQDQQRLLSNSIAAIAEVPAIDLELDDTIHVGAVSLHRLGYRLARAMQVLRGGKKTGKPPIAFDKVEINSKPAYGWADITVHFRNVEGQLQAGGRAMGFTIGDPLPLECIYRTDLQGDKVTLRTTLAMDEIGNHVLYYGYGLNPSCNITDSADRALPVAGPIVIAMNRALTPFQQTARVSKWVAKAGDLTGLAYPADLAALKFKKRTFDNKFLDLHQDESLAKQGDPLVYFQWNFECEEPMQLDLCLGYDGPVKMWVDGKEVLHDPAGTNPALADKKRVPLKAKTGRHEVLVALSLNEKRAWGIMFRIERHDVAAPLISRGPGNYKMPRFVD